MHRLHLLVHVTDDKCGIWGLFEHQPSLLGDHVPCIHLISGQNVDIYLG